MLKRAAPVLLVVALASTGTWAQVTGVFYNEGWESGTLTGTFNSPQLGRASDSGQYSVNNTVPGRIGSFALRHALTAGLATDDIDPIGQHFGDSPRTPVWPTAAGQHLYDLYVQYKFYYSPGFNFGTGHYKQFIIGTQDGRSHSETCCFPPAAHYITTLVEDDGTLQAEGYKKESGSPRFDINPNTGGYSNANPFIVQTGRWYTLELRRRLNDSGVDNGIFQMWVDGVLITNYTNVRYRIPINGSFGVDFTFGTNFMQLNDYSTTGVAQNQQVYYDDVKLSTAYIGLGSAPSKPTNLRIVPGL